MVVVPREAARRPGSLLRQIPHSQERGQEELSILKDWGKATEFAGAASAKHGRARLAETAALALENRQMSALERSIVTQPDLVVQMGRLRPGKRKPRELGGSEAC